MITGGRSQDGVTGHAAPLIKAEQNGELWSSMTLNDAINV